MRVRVRPGDGRRPPLVLCNGIGAGLEVLEPLVRALGPAGDVVSFDVPGTGSSPAPTLPYQLSQLAVLLGALLDRLDYGEIDLLGFSWGGALAQQFAAQNPTRCRRLVLASTSPGVLGVPGNPLALIKMITPRRHRDAAYAARIAPVLYGGSMRADPDRAVQLLRGTNGSNRGYLYQLGAVLSWTSLPFLPLIRQSTLLLFGDDDPIIPLTNGLIMQALLPHSTLRVLSGGHLTLLSDAAEVAPIIEEFLDDAREPGCSGSTGSSRKDDHSRISSVCRGR